MLNIRMIFDLEMFYKINQYLPGFKKKHPLDTVRETVSVHNSNLTLGSLQLLEETPVH